MSLCAAFNGLQAFMIRRDEVMFAAIAKELEQLIEDGYERIVALVERTGAD